MVEKKPKREEYSVKFGPLLKQALEKQKKNVDEVTYGCVKPSDYEAGEMIAKKVFDGKLL